MNRRRINCLREIVSALILSASSAMWAADDTGGLRLEVQGDSQQGYGMLILNNGKPIATHNGGGEFSAIFANGDRSLTLRQDDWRAESWTGDARQLKLHGQIHFGSSETVIDVQVSYDVLSRGMVRKKIRFHQPDAYLLYYQVSNSLLPAEPPQTLWSFDQADCQGGLLREYFPAAGFRTKDGRTVGLLTDADRDLRVCRWKTPRLEAGGQRHRQSPLGRNQHRSGFPNQSGIPRHRPGEAGFWRPPRLCVECLCPFRFGTGGSANA